MALTVAQLKKLFPNARADLLKVVVDHWDEAEAVGITTPKRIRYFLANVGVETGGLRAVEESLNYRSVAQIRKTWPTRFKSDAAAKPYVSNPEALAIKVYGGRLGNKPSPSTDGWDYRGGGMLQTTGRENYAKMGFEKNPEALRDPLIAFQTALREWNNRGCNALSDIGDFIGVRKKINGGTNGLKHAQEYEQKAKSIWPDTGTTPAKPAPKPRPRPVDRPAPEPAPEPVNDMQEPITDIEVVRTVQARLWELGYTEVGSRKSDGTFDGDFGNATKSAIAVFRMTTDLRWDPVIDKELLIALAAAKPRQIAAVRTDAPPAEIRAKVPEAQASWTAKVGSLGVLGTTSAVALVNGVAENVGPAKGLLDPVMDFFGDIPKWTIFLVIAVVAGAIWWQTRKAETKSIEAFHTGERR